MGTQDTPSLRDFSRGCRFSKRELTRSRRRRRQKRQRRMGIELPEVDAEALGQNIWTAQSSAALDAMMKGWAGESSATEANSNPQASNSETTSSAHAGAHSAAHAAAQASAQAAAQAAHSEAHAAASNDFAAMNNAFSGMHMTGGEDYLKNVGNFVAAALDPLGID